MSDASVIDRFNQIKWHDSKLLSFSVSQTPSGDVVKLELALHDDVHGKLRRTYLSFEGCAYVYTDIYLEAKRVCSNDISDADCSAESELIRRISRQNPFDSFEGYLHFELTLIPPGGTLSVLADGFKIEAVDEKV